MINYKKEEAFNIMDNKDNTFFHKLYLTNNISEPINAKLNYYLQKKTTNNKDFLNSITKVLINNSFNNTDYYSA